MIKVIIADDHPVVREGICRLVETIPYFTVSGQAENGEELLEKIRSDKYDLILLDISMPGMDGMDILRRIRAEWNTPILIISMLSDEHYAIPFILSGASGFVSKASRPSDIIEAIQKVSRGERYIRNDLLEVLLSKMSGDNSFLPHEKLSEREFQIFSLLVTGLRPIDIAHMLNIDSKTVCTHKKNIMTKMHMASLKDLMQYAREQKLLK
jgi:DNA-binding NarL/FixJ family response regulator